MSYAAPQPNSAEGLAKIALYKKAVEAVQKRCAETGESFTQGKVRREHAFLCEAAEAEKIVAEVQVETVETVTPIQAKLDAALCGVVQSVPVKPEGRGIAALKGRRS